MRASISAVAVETLADAIEARPSIREQLGESAYAGLLRIVADPRPEVVARQNRIFVRNWIAPTLRFLLKLAPEHGDEIQAALSAIRNAPADVPPVNHGVNLAIMVWEDLHGPVVS